MPHISNLDCSLDTAELNSGASAVALIKLGFCSFPSCFTSNCVTPNEWFGWIPSLLHYIPYEVWNSKLDFQLEKSEKPNPTLQFLWFLQSVLSLLFICAALNKPHKELWPASTHEHGTAVFLSAKKRRHCIVLLEMHEWLYLAREQKKACFSDYCYLKQCQIRSDFTPSSDVWLPM